ncbi:hypothetical protein ZOSMA_24G01310 [Zostera marina]|uniref:BZIP domain-containing protein n=1 Tax=Zostera marina TaxID=29655 RepID=A0A0K9PGE1_ZOSMR|nr:hypothetical protein ZOSMA_24G01310 [Zostera marina]
MQSNVSGNPNDSEYDLGLEMEFSLQPSEAFSINELFCAQKSSVDQAAVQSQTEVPFQPPPPDPLLMERDSDYVVYPYQSSPPALCQPTPPPDPLLMERDSDYVVYPYPHQSPALCQPTPPPDPLLMERDSDYVVHPHQSPALYQLPPPQLNPSPLTGGYNSSELVGCTSFRPFQSFEKLGMPPFPCHNTSLGYSHASSSLDSVNYDFTNNHGAVNYGERLMEMETDMEKLLNPPPKIAYPGSNPPFPDIFTGTHIDSNMSRSTPPHPSNINSDSRHHMISGSNIHTNPTTSSVVSSINPGDSNHPFLMTQLLGLGIFTMAEVQKIIKDPQLSEIACNDPKRAKKIISNRVSAEKAKERKKQYLIELEKTYKKLQVDVAVLPKSVQLEKEEAMRISRENEFLRAQISIKNEQAKAKIALTEALKREVEELKLLYILQQQQKQYNNMAGNNFDCFELESQQQQQQMFSSDGSMCQNQQRIGGCDAQSMSEMPSSNNE